MRHDRRVKIVCCIMVQLLLVLSSIDREFWRCACIKKINKIEILFTTSRCDAFFHEIRDDLSTKTLLIQFIDK